MPDLGLPFEAELSELSSNASSNLAHSALVFSELAPAKPVLACRIKAT